MKEKGKRAITIQPKGADWLILANGKEIQTPKGQPLQVPSMALAKAIAQEWRMQEGIKINPKQMPMQQFVATALDIVNADTLSYRAELLRYAETDLLCYWAEENTELADRQQRSWRPLLDWLGASQGIELRITHSVKAIAQADLPKLASLLEKEAAWRLTFLGSAVANTGSFLLGLALLKGEINAEKAHELANLDALFQEERWGADPDEIRRRQAIKADLIETCRFLSLLSDR